MLQKMNCRAAALGLAALVVVLGMAIGYTTIVQGSITPPPASVSSDSADRLEAMNAIHDLSAPSWETYYEYLRKNGELAWVDWSQDGCSTPPVTMGIWDDDFEFGCLRHDMTWRTLPIIDEGTGRIWNERNRWIADTRFEDDNNAACNADFAGGGLFQRAKRITCLGASWTFFQLVRHWKYDGTLEPTEVTSVNADGDFIVFPSQTSVSSVSCAPPNGRCMPVHYATLDGRPFAPANLGYIKTGQTVQLEIVRAHLQYGEGPPTKDGLDRDHPLGDPVNIGELTLKVKYPARADKNSVVSCLTTSEQTFYIDSEFYNSTKNSEDQSIRDTTLNVKICRDTTTSDPVELISFYPRQAYYHYAEDDPRYKDDDRVRHYQNVVAEGCHATEVEYPSRTENALLSTDCISRRAHGGYADYYTFKLSQTEDIQIDVRQVETLERVDPYVYLLRGNSVDGIELDSNDDGGLSRNSKILYDDLQQGDYTVVVTNYGLPNSDGERQFHTGEYVLEVREQEEDCFALPMWTDEVEGVWDDDDEDCSYAWRSDSYADFYTFIVEGTGNRTVRIDLDSLDDNYLYLIRGDDPTHRSIASNDNSDDYGLDARISQTLSPGTYTIVATTHDDEETGSYTLTVGGHR